MMEVVAIYDEEDEEAEENDLDFESYWEEQKDSLTTSSFQKSQMEKYEENLMKEVEQLLEPIERAILQQSAIPNLEKLSTVGVSESGIDDAVQKLVARGYKVSRIEQLESSGEAKARGANSFFPTVEEAIKYYNQKRCVDGKALILPSQIAEALDLDKTVLERVEEVAEDRRIDDIKGLLGHRNFKADMLDRKVSLLSGGEKARLAFCKFMVKPSTLIVLDEPTKLFFY